MMSLGFFWNSCGRLQPACSGRVFGLQVARGGGFQERFASAGFMVLRTSYCPGDINIIVELRTPAMPVGVGGGKERGGFHLNLRT